MGIITTHVNPVGIPHSGIKSAYVMRNRLDFSAIPVAASDVVEALKIPAGTMVLAVCTRVITAEGGTCTATVGDGDAAAGWDGSVNLNATAGTTTQSIPGTDATATTGKLYAAEDTIDLTMGHTTDAAVFDVYALCVDMNP